MDSMRISLFGQFRVQRGEQTLTGLEARKVQELFSYLLLNPEKSHPREALAGMLWGDSLTAQSRKYLRQALWQLHSALALPEEEGHSALLVIEPGWVRLNPEANFVLDVDRFQQACARVNGVPAQEFDEPTVQLVRQAIQSYRGDLLEGWYTEWCLCERERLQ